MFIRSVVERVFLQRDYRSHRFFSSRIESCVSHRGRALCICHRCDGRASESLIATCRRHDHIRLERVADDVPSHLSVWSILFCCDRTASHPSESHCCLWSKSMQGGATAFRIGLERIIFGTSEFGISARTDIGFVVEALRQPWIPRSQNLRRPAQIKKSWNR